jgi:hypothetical protein
MTIQALLDSVSWTKIDGAQRGDDSTPAATHEGVLDIAGHRFRCYRLDNGQAVFHADDINAFLDGFADDV